MPFPPSTGMGWRSYPESFLASTRTQGIRARGFSNFWSNPKFRWQQSICCRRCRAHRFGDRLQQENRLLDEGMRGASRMWTLSCLTMTCSPCAELHGKGLPPRHIVRRYEYQMHATRPYRLRRPLSRQRLSPRNIVKGLVILARLFWFAGVRGDYRRSFWKFTLRRLRHGQIEPILSVWPVRPSSHHVRARCLRGQGQCLALFGQGAGLELEATLPR